MASSTKNQPKIAQWLIDTRHLWPEADKTAQLITHASRALALLSEAERTSVLRYFHVRDAKLSLCSHLLKRYVVSRFATAHFTDEDGYDGGGNDDDEDNGKSTPTIKWWDSTLTRNAKGKPIHIDPATGEQPVVFNVSHQAGIVTLIAAYYDYEGYGSDEDLSHQGDDILAVPATLAQARSRKRGKRPDASKCQVGTDIVCVNERESRDHAAIARDGWDAFVDIHADVFAPGEVRYLKYAIVVPSRFDLSQGNTNGNCGGIGRKSSGEHGDNEAKRVLDYKLRIFYALWCLREGYVKMTGEALLAEWLRDLEFRKYDVPGSGEAGNGQDQVGTEFEVWLKDKKMDDVKIELRSFGREYMICSAVRVEGNKEGGLVCELEKYEVLRLEDILEFAEGRL